MALPGDSRLSDDRPGDPRHVVSEPSGRLHGAGHRVAPAPDHPVHRAARDRSGLQRLGDETVAALLEKPAHPGRHAAPYRRALDDGQRFGEPGGVANRGPGTDHAGIVLDRQDHVRDRERQHAPRRRQGKTSPLHPGEVLPNAVELVNRHPRLEQDAGRLDLLVQTDTRRRHRQQRRRTTGQQHDETAGGRHFGRATQRLPPRPDAAFVRHRMTADVPGDGNRRRWRRSRSHGDGAPDRPVDRGQKAVDHTRRRLARSHEAERPARHERLNRRIDQGRTDEARRLHRGKRRVDDVERVSANRRPRTE